MVTQYPHTLVFKTTTDPIYNQDTMTWEDGIQTEHSIKCRFVPNSTRETKLIDGEFQIFNYKVAIPPNQIDNIPTLINVKGYYKNGGLIYDGESKMFHRRSLHSILWV